MTRIFIPRACLLLGLVLGPSAPLVAATHTWTGAVSASWSNPANWTGGVPASGELDVDLVFAPTTGFKNIVNDISGLSLRTILFTGGGYVFSGTAVSLSDGITLAATATGGGAQIELNIAMTGSQTFRNDNNSNNLVVFDVLSGPPGVDLALAGTVFLAGADTYAGATTIPAGARAYIQNATSLGAASTGTTLSGGGIIQVNASGAGPTIAEPLTVVGTGTLQSSGRSTWTGPFDLSGDLTLYAFSSGYLTLTGPISGAGALLVSGPSIFTGTSPHTGPTTITTSVSAAVNGSMAQSPFTVTGGTLLGTGTVGSILLNADGTISPGGSPTANGPGVLTAASLTLGPTGTRTLRIELNGPDPGTGHDQLALTGNAAINGLTLALSRGFVAPVGAPLTILTCGGTLTGTLQGMPEGGTVAASGQTFQVHYTANAVTLTAITTPPNAPPTFAGADNVPYVPQGGGVAAALLGTVSDPDSPAGTLQVTLDSAPAGVTVAGLTNTSGVVTATLTATCSAPKGLTNVSLNVSDGLVTTTVAVPVNVADNQVPPVVIRPPDPTVVLRQTTCAPSRGMTLDQLQTKDPTLFGTYQAFLGSVQVTDDCGAATTFVSARLQGSVVTSTTFFAAGTTHLLQLLYKDAPGNIGSNVVNVTVRTQGDVTGNNVVDVFDVVAVSSYIVGNVAAGSAPFLAPALTADADGDGDVDVFDLVLLASYIVGNVPCLTP